MLQLLKMAFRDLGRNRRRSFFSALAVGVGLAILILMASVVNGEMGSSIEGAILLETGHIQVRATSYDQNRSSLKWEDLVLNPDQIASQIAALPQVKAATPRLFASGFISAGNQSAGARIIGIDPASAANDPYRLGIVSGSFLTADDSGGLLIGKPIAEKLHLQAGDNVSLSVNTSNGDVGEQTDVDPPLVAPCRGYFGGTAQRSAHRHVLHGAGEDHRLVSLRYGRADDERVSIHQPGGDPARRDVDIAVDGRRQDVLAFHVEIDQAHLL